MIDDRIWMMRYVWKSCVVSLSSCYIGLYIEINRNVEIKKAFGLEWKLWTPLQEGNLQLQTRLVFPPMASHSADRGLPTAKTLEHYQRFAANPAIGLIIGEHSYVDVQGMADRKQLSMASDRVILAQRELTTAVHQMNPAVKFFTQLSHAGAHTAEWVTGQELVSASVLESSGGTSRALTVPEIVSLEDEFAAAALRAKASGYDGIELHGAHAYLLNQFYSPLTNFRTDAYGPQSVENRVRFLRETVEKVRRAVGRDFSIAVRLGGCDYQPGGSTIADAVQASVLLEESGVDLLDLSGGMNIYMRQGHAEPGWFADMTAAVKQEVRIPVILTGGIQTPAQAEQLLAAGKADLIGVGRALWRNPSWGLESG